MRRRCTHARLGFRDGWLYIVHGAVLGRVRGWPGLEVEERRPDGTWESRDVAFRDQLYRRAMSKRAPVLSEFTFGDGRWRETEGGQLCFPWALAAYCRLQTWGMQAWAQFDATVPSGILPRLTNLPGDLWSSLVLVRAAPQLGDLLVNDPLLFAALARHWEFPAVGREDWDGLRRFAGRPRRELLGWLGYPATDANVNALRRHALIGIRPTRVAGAVREFLDLLHDPLYGPVLRKRPKTESELTSSLADPITRQWLDAEKLAEAFRAHRKKPYLIPVELREIATLVKIGLVEPTADFRRVRRALGRGNGDWSLDYIKDLPFPNWPCSCSAGIEPLTSVHALVREGREMESCVGGVGYIVAALRSEIAVFRVASPVRATMALLRGEGCWIFHELAGPKNAPIAPEHREWIIRGFSIRDLTASG